MTRPPNLSCAALLLAALPIALAPADAADLEVVQFRGPSADREPAQLPTSAFGLEVAWKHDLGSGYSNLWVEGDRAVTMFTAGEDDVLAAFDFDSGDELWRYKMNDRYVGHDGSDDGPIGTPTVADGTVYALGATGVLAAVSLADGSEQWRIELGEADSTVPFYGYTASPVIAGDRVLLATGGEGHALTAFDRSNGEKAWAAGDDGVEYQTPMVIDLGGRQQAVLAGNLYLTGFDPLDGTVLWTLQHTEGEEVEGSAHVTPIDDTRFLVKYGRGARLYRWTGSEVEEVWTTRAFGNSFALPVLIDDVLYGFTRNILTAASVDTGEMLWRQRQPAAMGLTAIGDRIALLDLDGALRIGDVSAEGFEELTRVDVLERGYYSVPTFSGDRFVVRNLNEIAAVRVDTDLAPQVTQAEPEQRHFGEFGEWVQRVEGMSAGRRQAAIDERFADVEQLPLVEGNLAHFVWQGDAEDVAVNGTVVGSGGSQGEETMYRIEGTNLFYRSFKLDPKGEATYSLVVDFGQPMADPKNPHTVDEGFAVLSELRMPEWPASPHLDEPEGPRGTVDRFQFRSSALANVREIQVWRPASYGRDAAARYPVLVVNHGDNLVRGGLMPNTLDNLVGESVAPLIAVFVPRVAGPEYGGDQADAYNRFLIEELLPHIDRHYRTDRGPRAILGPGSAGVAAVYAALSHPEVFAKASVQSYYAIEPAHSRILAAIEGGAGLPPQIDVTWSNNDYTITPGTESAPASEDLRDRLRAAGVAVRNQIADYTPGWGGWRGQHDEILQSLFPLEAQD